MKIYLVLLFYVIKIFSSQDVAEVIKNTVNDTISGLNRQVNVNVDLRDSIKTDDKHAIRNELDIKILETEKEKDHRVNDHHKDSNTDITNKSIDNGNIYIIFNI